jgi:hypothetical protein
VVVRYQVRAEGKLAALGKVPRLRRAALPLRPIPKSSHIFFLIGVLAGSDFCI